MTNDPQEMTRLRDVFLRDRAHVDSMALGVKGVKQGLRFVASCEKQHEAAEATRALYDALQNLSDYYQSEAMFYSRQLEQHI